MSRSEQVHVQDNYRKLSRDTFRNTHVGIEFTLPNTEHRGMHHSPRVHTTPPLTPSTPWSFIIAVLCTTKSGTLYILAIDIIYGCVINYLDFEISCHILVKLVNPVTFCNYPFFVISP